MLATVTDEEQGDLSLLVDPDQPRRGRARHRRRRRLRTFIASVLAIAVIGGLLVGIFYGGRAILGSFGSIPDYTGAGSGSVKVRINQGDTSSDIATTLVKAGVVQSERAFRDAANANPDSLTIQPGLYQLRAKMQASLALGRLLDPASRLFDVVTIPEGFTVEQVLLALSQATGAPLESFRSAAAQVDQLGLPAYSGGELEGFLFPATYELDPEADPISILQTMVARFTAMATSVDLEARAAAIGKSPYDVLTVASMVQSESRVNGERGMIARVIYNRLSQGIPLGIDATTAYDLGKPGTELTTADFRIDSPYNTRLNKGLPPTPISNPGEASVEAALAPAPGPWTYYVLEDSAGHHFFTDSAAEFQAAKARCQAAGLGCG